MKVTTHLQATNIHNFLVTTQRPAHNVKSLNPFRPVRPAGLDFQARPGPRAGPGLTISSSNIERSSFMMYLYGPIVVLFDTQKKRLRFLLNQTVECRVSSYLLYSYLITYYTLDNAAYIALRIAIILYLCARIRI